VDVVDELLGKPLCRRNIGIGIGLFLSKKSEHRTSAVIPKSAEL